MVFDAVVELASGGGDGAAGPAAGGVASLGEGADVSIWGVSVNFVGVKPADEGVVCGGPDPRKVDTSGVSYAAWVSVADVSASKSSGARRLHQECRLRVL